MVEGRWRCSPAPLRGSGLSGTVTACGTWQTYAYTYTYTYTQTYNPTSTHAHTHTYAHTYTYTSSLTLFARSRVGFNILMPADGIQDSEPRGKKRTFFFKSFWGGNRFRIFFRVRHPDPRICTIPHQGFLLNVAFGSPEQPPPDS